MNNPFLPSETFWLDISELVISVVEHSFDDLSLLSSALHCSYQISHINNNMIWQEKHRNYNNDNMVWREKSLNYKIEITLKLHMFLSGNMLASGKDYWFFPKNSALNLGTIFFLQRYLYLPYKLNGTLKKKTCLRFLCVFLKIWLWEEATISWKLVPIFYIFKLTVLFGGVKNICFKTSKQKCTPKM